MLPVLLAACRIRAIPGLSAGARRDSAYYMSTSSFPLWLLQQVSWQQGIREGALTSG